MALPLRAGRRPRLRRSLRRPRRPRARDASASSTTGPSSTTRRARTARCATPSGWASASTPSAARARPRGRRGRRRGRRLRRPAAARARADRVRAGARRVPPRSCPGSASTRRSPRRSRGRARRLACARPRPPLAAAESPAADPLCYLLAWMGDAPQESLVEAADRLALAGRARETWLAWPRDARAGRALRAACQRRRSDGGSGDSPATSRRPSPRRCPARDRAAWIAAMRAPRPELRIRGRDLVAAGVPPGPRVGRGARRAPSRRGRKAASARTRSWSSRWKPRGAARGDAAS